MGKFTKLEQLHIDREIDDIENTFGGLKGMEAVPHVLFVVDAKHEEIAVKEAQSLGIPVVGILNSDCNTNDTDYFIVGNDSSVASITYFLNQITEAFREGFKTAPEKKEEEGKKKEIKK